jgi:hypothetical protein
MKQLKQILRTDRAAKRVTFDASTTLLEWTRRAAPPRRNEGAAWLNHPVTSNKQA